MVIDIDEIMGMKDARRSPSMVDEIMGRGRDIEPPGQPSSAPADRMSVEAILSRGRDVDPREAFAPGVVPEHPLQEEHPEVPRLLLMNFAATPETAMRYLEERGFETFRLPGFNFSLRKKGEREWRIFDPEKLELIDDITDVLGDIWNAFGAATGATAGALSGLAGGPAGSLTLSMVGGAGGGAIAESAKQGLGAMLGVVPTPGESVSRVAEEGAYGALGEAVGFGVSKAAKALKPHAQAIAGKVLSKVKPHSAEDLYAKNISELRKMVRAEGLKDVDNLSKDELIDRILSRPQRPRHEFERAYHGIGAKYLKGTTDYDQQFHESILARRLEPESIRARANQEGPIDLEEAIADIKSRPYSPGSPFDASLYSGAADAAVREQAEREIAERLARAEEAIRRETLAEAAGEQAEYAARHRPLARNELERMSVDEVRGVAGDRGIPNRGTKGEIVRTLYQRQPLVRAQRALGGSLQWVGKLGQWPGQQMRRGLARLMQGRYAGIRHLETREKRNRAVEGIATAIDDIFNRVDPLNRTIGGQRFDPSHPGTREFLKQIETLKNLIRPDVGGRRPELSGVDIIDLYQSLFTAFRKSNVYVEESVEKNVGNLLRKELFDEYDVPWSTMMDAAHKSGSPTDPAGGFWTLFYKNPDIAIGTGALFLPYPIMRTSTVIGAARIGGSLVEKLGQKLMNSTEPLQIILRDPAAPGPVKRLAQKAIDFWNAGEHQKYRSTVYILLTKADVRRDLEARFAEQISDKSGERDTPE